MPCPDRGSSIPHPGPSWGGATARQVGASRQCRDSRDPPLAPARDSATERPHSMPSEPRSRGSSGRRCAAGALCWDWDMESGQVSRCKHRGSRLAVRGRDFRPFTLARHPQVPSHRAVALSPKSLPFFLFRKRGHSFPWRLIVRGSLSGPPSRRIAGVPEETGNRVAGPGLARRPFSPSAVARDFNSLSPHLPHLTSPPLPSHDHDHGKTRVAHSPSPRPRPPTLIYSVSTRPHSVATPLLLSPVAVAQSRALLSLSDQGRGSVGRSGRLLRRRRALP
jgi:hypothetical protein